MGILKNSQIEWAMYIFFFLKYARTNQGPHPALWPNRARPKRLLVLVPKCAGTFWFFYYRRTSYTIKEPNPNQTNKPCRLQNKTHIQCFHLYDDLPTTWNSFINFICLNKKKTKRFQGHLYFISFLLFCIMFITI